MAKCRGMPRPLPSWYTKVSAKSFAIFFADAVPRQTEKFWIFLDILLPTYLSPEFRRLHQPYKYTHYSGDCNIWPSWATWIHGHTHQGNCCRTHCHSSKLFRFSYKSCNGLLITECQINTSLARTEISFQNNLDIFKLLIMFEMWYWKCNNKCSASKIKEKLGILHGLLS